MRFLTTTLVAVLLFGVFSAGYATASSDAGVASQPTSQPTAAPAEPADPVAGVSSIVALFKAGEYRSAIAAVITLLIFFWRRYAQSWAIVKIPAKHVAWVTALVGLIAALPAHLVADPFVWRRFLLDGFLIGGRAVLLWSTVGKHVLPKVFGDVPEKKPQPIA
jgi:uncharacterized SAM-binding protein YcdF (DUF218 family)